MLALRYPASLLLLGHLFLYNGNTFCFFSPDSDSAPSNVATGNSHNVLNTNEHKAGSNKKTVDNQKEGKSDKSDNPEKKDEEVKKKVTRKEKSVLQSKLTRLAIQIGYAGKSFFLLLPAP